ncbi:MAG TPA: PIG-L family deacetylase, partial [Streptomyces sp.]|nr:PIG-L family deacetylase [Streptomyces sp.]
HYPSQRHRPWYDREAFLGLARIRGIECHARYAEAFAVTKLTLNLGE